MGRASREQSLATAIRLWLAVLLLALGTAARAQGLVADRAWLEEAPGEALTLVQAQAWAQAGGGRPFEGALSRGYGGGAVWLRLRIDPAARPPARRQPGELVLRIRPAYLDDVQVFDPLAAGGLAGRVGDRQPPWLDALRGQDFLLPIARGAAPRELWLRLESTSTRQIHVEVLDFDELEPALLRQGLVWSLYVGLVAMLVAWGLIRWTLTGELLMAAFAWKELTALLFALGSMGFLRVFWPPSWGGATLDPLVSVFSILGVNGGALFHLVFLREFRPPRWSLALLAVVVAGAPLLLLMMALGQTRLALTVNMVAVLVSPWLILLNALLARGWAHPDPAQRPLLPRAMVIGFCVVFVLLLAWGSGAALAWAPASPWTIYVMQVHGLVGGILVLLMLQYRSRRIGRQRQQMLLALERSRLQAEHERRLHEEQKKLLAMLAHEIKTPLATMHMRLDAQAPGSREIRGAMRDMNAVIDRCMQAALLSDGELAAQLAPHDASGLVREAIAACSQPGRVQAVLPPRLRLRTDRQLLFIVLGNLLENACKYSAEGTPIELTLQAGHDGMACLVLRNRPGDAGWPDPERLFMKFYRSPQAQRRAGTGLGLYLVSSLAATLGGRIDYRPEDGWVRFVLQLPLAREAGEAGEAAPGR